MRRIQCKKNVKWEYTKSTKYHYLFLMMEFIHLLTFIKTKKNRSTQMNKIKKDAHKWLQIKTNACK